ncbi:MAG: copper chaperone PCu(A)C [Hyphomonadaceae bacterium]
MTRLLFPAALIAAAAIACAPAKTGVSVDDARIAPPPGGRDVTAAYFTVHDAGGGDRLLGVSSPSASSAELHVSEEGEGGMMSMRRVDALDVPANGALTLSPGGAHVMLFGVSGLAGGGKAKLVLRFEKVGAVEVEADVKPVGPAMDMSHP